MRHETKNPQMEIRPENPIGVRKRKRKMRNPKSQILSCENGDPIGRRKREMRPNRKINLGCAWVFVSPLQSDTNSLFARKNLSL